MFKRERDAALDVFERGCLTLWREGALAGHVATSLGSFWSPGRPLTIQQQVWFVIVWADGEREASFEDYPPWTVVTEIQGGFFTWDDAPRSGRYTATWLSEAESAATWDELGISLSDF
ncbi:hypothetical protein [Cellulosimicrobium funkei]|uniref:hypothetical protein n=1 Tax=Cellulosimicrobium funkei TaxID=264251 RepID=UPI00343A8D40